MGLAQTLRTLERDGLVSRSITPSVPVRVDYSLTSLGVTLLPVMQAIKDWAETHIEKVTAARDTYDNRDLHPDLRQEVAGIRHTAQG
ncbi:winged helix-turn-helix transcriptional regulator [Sphaerisporangium viridialbum]|uniref:winged helix-turn-helix transcriptional regulator n=1 Tax=Sphaerisporangium viridialbum TaxID=46189 RepID=UPI003C775A19